MRHHLLALLISGAPLLAHAQSNPLVTDRDRYLRPPPAMPPTDRERYLRPPAPTPPANAPAPSANAPAAPLSRVAIEGATSQGPAIETAWRPFVGKPLTADTIRDAADAISLTYKREGLALYTVQVPQQDFAGGVLRLQVIEGHIEEAVIHGDTKDDLILVHAYAAKLTEEKPLTQRTLERYLSLIRDIPGLTPDIQLLQGATPGGVNLAIGLDQKKSEVAYTLNTRAQPLLGETQLQADWTLNGLFRQGDQTRFTGAVSSDLDRFRYVGAAHSQPLGSEGVRAQISVGRLRTRPDLVPVEGKATTAGLIFSYPAIRGYQKSLYFSGGLDALNSDSAVFGQTLATERTRVLRAAAAYSRQTPKQAIGLNLGLSSGLDGLGARVNQLLADEEFFKADLRAGFERKLGKVFTLRLRAAYQETSDALPASEQMSLGGGEYGRAFDTSLLLADRGAAGSVELGWAPARATPARGLSLGEIYVFADAGDLTRNARPTLIEASDHLSSAGLGVRIGLGSKLGVGVEAAVPVDTPAGYPSDDIRWTFSLRGTY